MHPPRLLRTYTVSEVADRLAVTTRTVNRWARSGYLPTVGKGNGRTGAYRFVWPVVEDYATRHGVTRADELIREVHPGDMDHGLKVVGRLLDRDDLRRSSGIQPVTADGVRRWFSSAGADACDDPECRARAREDAEDR